MHFAEPPSDHIRQIAERVANGTFTDGDVRALEAAIAGDAKDRAFYLEYCQLHADLQLIMTADRATASVREKMEGKEGIKALRQQGTEAGGTEAETKDQGERRKDEEVVAGSTLSQSSGLTSHSSRSSFLTQHNVGIGVAAGLLFIVGLLSWAAVTYWPEMAKKDEKQEKQENYVALLSGRQSVVWRDGMRPLLDRSRLTPGRRLTFDSGLIEIEYLTGARVVIEGPADFTVGKKAEGTKAQERENFGFLKFGKLVARIESPTAMGFTIETPQARVKDLGTEFGVDVERSGASTVTVFEGRVEVGAYSDGASPIVVAQGQSVDVAADGTVDEKTVTEHDDFVRRMPDARDEFDPPAEYVAAVKQSEPVAYWRFTTADVARFANEMGSAHPLRIVGSVPLQRSGEHNYAATFRRDGPASALVCDDIRSVYAGDYTFEAWVQSTSADYRSAAVASATVSDTGVAMLCALRGTQDPQSQHFKIRYLHRSPPGTSGGRDLFSQTLIWTGRWYHVATVRKDGTTTLWVDGKNESSAQDAPPVKVDNLKLVIGQLLEPGRHSNPNLRPFIGLLDEIAIYDRALTPDEIRGRVELAYPSEGIQR